ncbi:MAG: TonB-dependent receptor, partial [Prevotella sp.]|nr:TonB-dependent receptor [Prevotella sp.]
QPAGIASVALQDLLLRPSDNSPSKSPVTWNISARLTKELGKLGALSFFVNNVLFYEPFLKGNNTNSLSQRNTGTFAFGAELSLKL